MLRPRFRILRTWALEDVNCTVRGGDNRVVKKNNKIKIIITKIWQHVELPYKKKSAHAI